MIRTSLSIGQFPIWRFCQNSWNASLYASWWRTCYCHPSISYHPRSQDTLLKLRCCVTLWHTASCRSWRRVCPRHTGDDGSVWHRQSFDPAAAAGVNFWYLRHCPSMVSVIHVKVNSMFGVVPPGHTTWSAECHRDLCKDRFYLSSTL